MIKGTVWPSLLMPLIKEAWLEAYNPKKEKQMYKILNNGKRFNSKSFESYEAARQYLRRWTTKKFGVRIDNIGALGFSITQ
jgi:hypothetical protein